MEHLTDQPQDPKNNIMFSNRNKKFPYSTSRGGKSANESNVDKDSEIKMISDDTTTSCHFNQNPYQLQLKSSVASASAREDDYSSVAGRPHKMIKTSTTTCSGSNKVSNSSHKHNDALFYEEQAHDEGEKENSSSDNNNRQQVQQTGTISNSSTTRVAAQKLERILGDIKHTTSKLLNEMETYMKTAQKVKMDFEQCEHSQAKNSNRLDEMEGEVHGATDRFINIASASARVYDKQAP